jgi:hypothetical protein
MAGREVSRIRPDHALSPDDKSVANAQRWSWKVTDQRSSTALFPAETGVPASPCLLPVVLKTA